MLVVSSSSLTGGGVAVSRTIGHSSSRKFFSSVSFGRVSFGRVSFGRQSLVHHYSPQALSAEHVQNDLGRDDAHHSFVGRLLTVI
jgi:hypothetical protein